MNEYLGKFKKSQGVAAVRSPKLLIRGEDGESCQGAVGKESKGRSQCQAATRGRSHARVHVQPSGRWRPAFRARGPARPSLRSAYNLRRGHWDSQSLHRFNPISPFNLVVLSSFRPSLSSSAKSSACFPISTRYPPAGGGVG